MKNRIKKLMLWATVLAMLLTGMSAALADTQSATFVLQVRPKPTEAPAATDVPAAQAPATEAPATKAPATKAPELTYEEDEVAAPVEITFQRDENGDLILDENGDPIPVLPEGVEAPTGYQRDENGTLVLDADGDPIPLNTVPEGGEKLATIVDEMSPDRSIDIYALFEGDYLNMGDKVTLITVLTGYEKLVYTYQWQVQINGEWTDIEGATSSAHSFELTEENYTALWRVKIEITDALVE